MRSLSTGEVAKITQSSVQSVIRWINAGMLKAWKVPGSRFRRIEEGNLRTFMVQHNIPLQYLDAGTKRVLVISQDESLRSLMAPLRPHGLPVTCAPPFEAGMKMIDTPIALVVIDESLGESTVKGIVATLHSRATDASASTIAVASLRVQSDGDHRASRDGIIKYLNQRVGEALRPRP